MNRAVRKSFGVYLCVGNDVIAWEWYRSWSREMDFFDSAQRDEFNDIQHEYIRPNHYRVLGWSGKFHG